MHINIWKLDVMFHDNGWFIAWDSVIKFDHKYAKQGAK